MGKETGGSAYQDDRLSDPLEKSVYVWFHAR